jgi:phosphoglycerate-specific signal transduction histidine kinase
LIHIDEIGQFYEKAIQHLFSDISQLLRVPFEDDLNQRIEQIPIIIRFIDEFLNELRQIENHLLSQSTQSLKEICSILGLENEILDFLSDEVKCENYVTLSIKLIEIHLNIFDELGRNLSNDIQLKDIYRSNSQIQIQIIQSDQFHLCQLTMKLDESKFFNLKNSLKKLIFDQFVETN